MNQNIITYLNENKEQYPKDVLIAELKKAGYAEGDIAEGIAQVFGGAVPATALTKTSFWNFKDKKVYTSAGQKWADFLFGFFAPIFVVTASGVPLIFDSRSSPVSFLFFALEIVLIIRLFNRRRFISYGMIVSVIILPIIAILSSVAMFVLMSF